MSANASTRAFPALTVLSALAALACACASPHAHAPAPAMPAAHSSFTDADRQALKTMLRDQQAAWNGGDLEAFMAAYEPSDDLVFTSGGNIRRGWQTTLDKYRARYGDDQASMGQLDFEILDIRGLGDAGESAVILGTWRVTGPQSGHGVFSLVCVRTPDGWRIVHDHTSSGPEQGDDEPDTDS